MVHLPHTGRYTHHGTPSPIPSRIPGLSTQQDTRALYPAGYPCTTLGMVHPRYGTLLGTVHPGHVTPEVHPGYVTPEVHPGLYPPWEAHTLGIPTMGGSQPRDTHPDVHTGLYPPWCTYWAIPPWYTLYIHLMCVSLPVYTPMCVSLPMYTLLGLEKV